MRYLSKANDKNEFLGITFSPDGSRGLVFGAEIQNAATYPVFFVIDMYDGYFDTTGGGNL